MSSKAGKRPSRQATTAEKLDAIQRVQNGESKASVARDINVPESTLRGWCKNQERILQDHRKSQSPDHEITSEPKSKKLKVDNNSNSIQRPFNLSIKLAQADSMTTAENKHEEEICPQNLSTITVDNGRSSLGKEKNTPVGLSLIDQVRSEVVITQQISDFHNDRKNERSALEINGRKARSPVSTSAQPSSFPTFKPLIKQNPMKLSKENMYQCNGWNKFLECQRPSAYDARKMNHGESSFDEIFTLPGPTGTFLSSKAPSQCSNAGITLLRQLLLMNFEQEMIFQRLSSSGNPNSEPVLYHQSAKPAHLSVAKPAEQPFEPAEQPFELEDEQVYAEDLSLHARGEKNSDTSGSPEQCFRSNNASPADSKTSDSRTPSPTPAFPATTASVQLDMSTPVSSFPDFSMRHRENGNHYRETGHNNVSKKVVNTSSQSSSNGQKSFRKILKPKFEINNLLPENERNKYLDRNRNDSGFTDDDEDIGSVLAAGEKFLKWLERGKEKSVTHIQVNQVREIVNRLRSKV